MARKLCFRRARIQDLKAAKNLANRRRNQSKLQETLENILKPKLCNYKKFF